MRTVNKKNLLGAGLAIAMALVASQPTTGRADDQAKPTKPTKPMKEMKGSEHLMMLSGVGTKQEVDALKTDDTIAMVCAKCKTVWTTRIKEGVHGSQILNEHGQPTELIGTHGCKGCNSIITVTGHARGDITELRHSCKACGDESAFCCATKPGSGATKGMKKKETE